MLFLFYNCFKNILSNFFHIHDYEMKQESEVEFKNIRNKIAGDQNRKQ